MSKKVIVLNDNFSIYPSTDCWTLKQQEEGEINPKTGKPSIKVSNTFHGTLKQALDAFVDKSLKTSLDISMLQEKLQELEDFIKNTDFTEIVRMCGKTN